MPMSDAPPRKGSTRQRATLTRQKAFLSTLLDAEYGSATFVSVTRPAELELRVSTTGLLMRDSTPLPR